MKIRKINIIEVFMLEKFDFEISSEQINYTKACDFSVFNTSNPSICLSANITLWLIPRPF